MRPASRPQLDLDKSAYREQRICDVGCGDGRNVVLFRDLGLEVREVEISKEIAALTAEGLGERPAGGAPDGKKGRGKGREDGEDERGKRDARDEVDAAEERSGGAGR